MSPIGSGAVLSGLDIAAGCVVNPDGGSAAFFSNAKGSPGIWIVDLADGSCRRVLSSARAAPLCWDPTGSRLAVVEEGVSIAVVEVGGGAAQVVYQLPARG
jgi:Tol biopolymer transport system component